MRIAAALVLTLFSVTALAGGHSHSSSFGKASAGSYGTAIPTTDRFDVDSDVEGNDWFRRSNAAPSENRYDVDTDVDGNDWLRRPLPQTSTCASGYGGKHSAVLETMEEEECGL